MSQIKDSSSFALKLFYFGSSMQRIFRRFSESIHSAVFMGLIDDSEFQQHDTYPFGNREEADPVSETDDEPMQRWIGKTFAERLPTGSRVLVVGAGGGREIRGLRNMGYEVTGWEFDPDLARETRIALAKIPACSSVKIYESARFSIPGHGITYDAILFARYYFSYIHGREKRIELLSSIRPQINDGGLFAADYFTRPDDPRTKGSLAFRIQVPIANFLRALRGRGTATVETGDHVDPDCPLYHHHFTTEEIESELVVAGFKTVSRGVSWFGWTSATPFNKIPTASAHIPPRQKPTAGSPVPGQSPARV